MNRQWLIIGAVVLVLFASYFWNRNRNLSSATGETPAAEEIIQQNGTVVKKTGDTVQELTQEEIAAQQQAINEKVATATPITLQASENQKGSGNASRTVDNGTYYQKVTVEGLTPLQKGYYYEGWLQKADGSQASIGRIEMNGSNGQLLYSGNSDRSDYSKMVVARQQENGTTTMGETVLEGNF